jgi:hypothetical protein
MIFLLIQAAHLNIIRFVVEATENKKTKWRK